MHARALNNQTWTIVNRTLLPSAVLAVCLLVSRPASGQSPPFTGIIPGPIGQDTSPAILLVIDSDGSLRVKTDPTQPPFDGIEDTLIGVLNLSANAVSAIPIRDPQPVFDFDG